MRIDAREVQDDDLSSPHFSHRNSGKLCGMSLLERGEMEYECLVDMDDEALDGVFEDLQEVQEILDVPDDDVMDNDDKIIGTVMDLQEELSSYDVTGDDTGNDDAVTVGKRSIDDAVTAGKHSIDDKLVVGTCGTVDVEMKRDKTLGGNDKITTATLCAGDLNCEYTKNSNITLIGEDLRAKKYSRRKR